MTSRDPFFRTFWPLIAGAAATLLVSCVYFVNFGASISHSQSIWADFGNYLGGVVGPLLSLLTIFLVLETLRVQREELTLSREELRKSSEALETQARQFAQKNLKDDLMNRADVVYAEVIRLRGESLNAPIYFRTAAHVAQAALDAGRVTEGPVTPGNSWDDVMKQAVPRYAEMLTADDERARPMVKALTPLTSTLDELSQYLDDIDRLSGDRRATNFYRRRLQTTVLSLQKQGFITNELMGRFDSTGPDAVA
jgi:hypothetical protein